MLASRAVAVPCADPYLAVLPSTGRRPARLGPRARAHNFRRRATGRAGPPIDQPRRKEVSHVYMPPHMGSQLASERRREMLAQAQRQHQARKVAVLARASRRAERAERRMRRAVRKALRLRAGLEQ